MAEDCLKIAFQTGNKKRLQQNTRYSNMMYAWKKKNTAGHNAAFLKSTFSTVIYDAFASAVLTKETVGDLYMH